MPIVGPSPSVLDYWSTWATQGATAARHDRTQRDQIDWALMAGPEGWLHDIDADIRGGMLVVLDDGWDIPRGMEPQAGRRALGSVIPDPGRFPLGGSEAIDRLSAIANGISALGYAGTGLWIAAQASGESPHAPMPAAEQEAYWSERLDWSQKAGIRYWKIDWGVHWNDAAFRRMITRLARCIAPDLIIEHSVVMAALNDWNTSPVQPDDARGTGRFGGEHAELLKGLVGHADVIRTYDASGTHAAAVTFDRVASLLGVEAGGRQTHVNVEGKPHLAAGLGMCAGLMMHPRHWRSGRQPAWDSMRRYLNWRTRVSPLALGCPAHVSETVLWSESRESRTVMDEGSPEEVFVPVRQGAPATITRNMAPPRVEALGPEGMPFVAATRHACGSIAVAVLERHIPDHGEVTPSVRISLDLEGGTGPIAVFGRVGELRLRTHSGGMQARDLLGGGGFRVPADFRRHDGTVVLDGAWLAAIGTSAGTPGDPSAPGLILETTV